MVAIADIHISIEVFEQIYAIVREIKIKTWLDKRSKGYFSLCVWPIRENCESKPKQVTAFVASK